MKAQPVQKPCDVRDCKSPWLIVIYIRDDGAKAVKHSVKLCPTHYQEFKAGKSPTLRG